MRCAPIVAVVGICLLFFAGGSATTSASTAAGTRTYWLTGREAVLPAQARGGALASVSCASAGKCTAVGRYVDQAGNRQGLLLTEAAGRWRRGVKAALPSNAEGAFLDSVSCVSAGDCTAVGADDSQGLLLTKTAGIWAPGVEAELPANGSSAEAVVLDVSCASAGNCAAVGAYGSFPPDKYGCPGCSTRGLLLTEKAGVWSKGVEAALPADAAPASEQLASVASVSCPSAGNCSAVGSYVDGSGNYHGLLLTETAGIWGSGVEAALPPNAAGQGAGPNSVSCASAGNCTAVGSYADSSGNNQGLLVTETAGTWARGVEAALPSDASSTSQDASVGSVSCASPGNCTAVGSYLDGSGAYNSQGLLLTETAGVWSRGIEAALPGDAALAGQTVYLNSLSCASAGNCSVAGEYVDSSSHGEGLLLTETEGTWATGVAPALPARLHNVRLVSVSCSSAGNCAALGDAFDSGHSVGLLVDSTSTPPCVVPRLKGKTLSAARRSLRAHDCSLGRIKHARSSNIEQGHVISQTPRAGIHLRREAKVDLTVSKGKN